MVELLRRGSIEQVSGREVGNVTERLYRALRTSEYSAADYRDMDEDDRHITMGVTLQNATAEHLAAFRAGEMAGDNPNVVMLWAWFVLDEEGKAEMTAELEANWRRMKEIEARSADRRTRSKDEGQSVIVSTIAIVASVRLPRTRPWRRWSTRTRSPRQADPAGSSGSLDRDYCATEIRCVTNFEFDKSVWTASYCSGTVRSGN